jgi:NAD(P)-dependent dehydrogenase (short-subunit alcohol dehydrogenase family)
VGASVQALEQDYGDRARIRVLDVTNQADVDRLAGEVRATHGALDALINNAAIHYDTQQVASKASLRIIEEAIATNLVGAWRMAMAMTPLLGAREHACLVNVSSGAGALGVIGANRPAYAVTKAALNALTIALAADLRSQHTLVNAVCPGWVATDMGGEGGRPTPEGARGIVWAATLPPEGPSGGFFWDGQPISWIEG